MASRAFPPWFSWFLESGLRLRMLSPSTLVARLPLAPDFVVVEVGSGTGVYARAVRPQARVVVGAELQWPMIEKARELDRVLMHVQANALALPLRSNSVDLVYLITALGELTHPADALRGIFGALRPGGFLSISEHIPDPDYVSAGRLRRLCTAAGFEFLRRDGPWWSYTSTFQKPRSVP